ncbi:MAG: hypothetical protein E6736_14210, partial [Leclercia adecarboxylata]|nr:hypothetical protein [Leclercia adecarboxylata]
VDGNISGAFAFWPTTPACAQKASGTRRNTTPSRAEKPPLTCAFIQSKSSFRKRLDRRKN